MLCAGPLSGEQKVIQRFEELVSAERSREGLELLEQWLAANPDAASFGEVLDRFMRAETSVASLRRALERVLGAVTAGVNHVLVLERLAWLEETTGRFEESLGRYLAAAALTSGEPKAGFLVSAARILYEGGFLEEAERSAVLAIEETDSTLIQGNAAVLLGYIYLAREEGEKALREFQKVMDQNPPWAAEPAAILGLIHLHIDDGEQAERYLRLLEEKYEEAPEYDLALSVLKRGAKVRYPISPTRMFEDAGEAEPTEPVTRQPVLIQTGSFSEKENAGYMLSELHRLDFPARIREVEINGQVYYRVVIGEFTTEEQIQGTVVRLKEHGFEGFQISVTDN